MRGLFAVFATYMFVLTTAAQPPQIAVTAGDSIPQMTIVPVVEPAVHVVERTTVYETPDWGLTHAERRAERAERFAAGVDSLIQSRNYMFFPNSMQETPGGMIRGIYADFYFLGLFVDQTQMHLPTEQDGYVGMLNFDSEVNGYDAMRMLWGWNVTFDITDGGISYAVSLAVTRTTGETVLTLLAPSFTMRYVGWLWNRQRHDGRH